MATCQHIFLLDAQKIWKNTKEQSLIDKRISKSTGDDDEDNDGDGGDGAINE